MPKAQSIKEFSKSGSSTEACVQWEKDGSELGDGLKPTAHSQEGHCEELG